MVIKLDETEILQGQPRPLPCSQNLCDTNADARSVCGS